MHLCGLDLPVEQAVALEGAGEQVLFGVGGHDVSSQVAAGLANHQQGRLAEAVAG